ncbi:hypothetical protein M408DRAFT_28595 [Serendipita vermifera MAFF 305830]|uniref:Uncharacterized protein n=1 Tax=Serendipita vermifera MAFF 305830 TaxID=933852 RepID=A0A0C2WZC7_SERVB|nr:hypothetical protein M408DRAFT_28595 [Serendipita vermifera MAFF 305830]
MAPGASGPVYSRRSTPTTPNAPFSWLDTSTSSSSRQQAISPRSASSQGTLRNNVQLATSASYEAEPEVLSFTYAMAPPRSLWLANTEASNDIPPGIPPFRSPSNRDPVVHSRLQSADGLPSNDRSLLGRTVNTNRPMPIRNDPIENYHETLELHENGRFVVNGLSEDVPWSNTVIPSRTMVPNTFLPIVHEATDVESFPLPDHGILPAESLGYAPPLNTADHINPVDSIAPFKPEDFYDNGGFNISASHIEAERSSQSRLFSDDLSPRQWDIRHASDMRRLGSRPAGPRLMPSAMTVPSRFPERDFAMEAMYMMNMPLNTPEAD